MTTTAPEFVRLFDHRISLRQVPVRGDSLMSNHFHLVVTGQVEDAENTNSRVYELESSRTQSFPNGPDGGAFRVGPEKRTGKERRVRPTA